MKYIDGEYFMKKLLIFIFILIPLQANAKNPYLEDWHHTFWLEKCEYDYSKQMCTKSININYKEYNLYHQNNKYYCIKGKLYKEVGQQQKLTKLTPATHYTLPTTCDRNNAEYFNSMRDYKKSKYRGLYNPYHKQFDYNYTRQFR